MPYENESAKDVVASGRPQERPISSIRATVHAVGYSYSGPLPPPEILRQFEDALPGSAERIFVQFEAQAEHRRRIESKIVAANTFSQQFGSTAGLLIGLLGVGGGIWLTHDGKSVAGLTSMFVTLGGLVSAYLYKRRQQSAELAERRASPGMKN